MTFEEWYASIEQKGLVGGNRPTLDDYIKKIAALAWLVGQKHAPLPQSIQEALNSGDGTYRP